MTPAEHRAKAEDLMAQAWTADDFARAEKAAEAWEEARDLGVVEAVAAALAAERERVLAPFLALAEHYAADEPKLSTETMRIFRDVARDIRRVVEAS